MACFSYTPCARTEVHNANLLGASFLCRLAQLTGQQRFLEPALEAARYSVRKQHPDGSWDYGESPHQHWIDNFHTGYNLVALKRIREFGKTGEFDAAITRGLDFYTAHFFRPDGAPRYFHDATYPVDVHSVAQSIITLHELGTFGEDHGDLSRSVLRWSLDNLWDTRGFFYYQRWPHRTVRTSFMRWSQAWMLLALSTFLEQDQLYRGKDD